MKKSIRVSRPVGHISYNRLGRLPVTKTLALQTLACRYYNNIHKLAWLPPGVCKIIVHATIR